MTIDLDRRPTADIVLDFPVTAAGAAIDRLTMRRPTVRDEIAYADAKGPVGQRTVQYMADLCGVERTVIETLDLVDFRKLGDQLAAFRGDPANPTGPGPARFP